MENVSRAACASALGPLGSAADECLVFDLEGRVVAANAAACRALDRAQEELLGQRAWELVTCLTAQSFEHTVEAIRSEGPQSLLGHLRRRDGGLIATDTRLWLDELAGVPRVFALAREMRGCQVVVEERDQLQHLVEASSEFVFLFDSELRATYVNAAALARLGIERVEDALGLGLHELFTPAQRALVEEQMVPRLRRESWDGELELYSWKDAGTTTPCWVHAFPVQHTRTKKRVGFALVARDISARRAADERRTRLMALAEVSRRVAVHLLEKDDLNQAVFEILAGVAQALSVPHGYLHRFREDGRWLLRTHEWTPERGPEHQQGGQADQADSYAWATSVLERGEALRVDDALPLPAGTGRGLLDPGARALLLLPALIHGRLESVFAFVHDRGRAWLDDEVAAVQLIIDSFARGVERQIAERERSQARHELELAVEREKVANRYKSEFLASMSHELRTPMNAIRGYAELLSRPHPERALQELWIQNLRRSTEYLLGLVHDVLDLSKIEAGHMQLAREPAALADVLGSVEDLLAASAREKCLEFTVALEGEVPESFETDPVRLKQILVNLVGNAIKFTNSGSVAVRARQKGSATEGHTLELRVSDTGIGIPEPALDKLFRPFSQVNQRSGGTGLGLQISRSLARLLGGDVAVQSVVGKGSVFTLELPLDGARGVLRALPSRQAVNSQPARALPAVLRGKRILIVDDSFENREVLRFLLQEAGATSEMAMNGQAGVERALAAEKARTPFDAILMDMNMPVLNGFEATQALRAGGVSSPVIALTALALAGDEERCRAAGCVAYVGKPIVPSAFFDTLAKHVRAREPVAAQTERPHAGEGPAQGEGQLLSLAQHPRFRGLIERYVASFPELVDKIRRQERAGHLDEVRTLVHRLRGTAATYGFPAVSQAAGRCEDAIRAGASREEIRRMLDELLGRLTLAAAG
ncbi:MAG: response regulator [Planctomycetes bacterium]|nr:response regulator [Planctomycetota bacterium]